MLNNDYGAGARLEADEITPEYAAARVDLPSNPPSGGDFYSAFPIHEGSDDVAVVIGDVAGHGPEQTPQAEHMRELLADCLIVGMSPAETLAAVNAMIEPDPNFEGFGTVFVGTINGIDGTLTYASGGHEPALIASPATKEGVIEELKGTGPPVGAFPGDMARYEEHQAVVPAGGTLLLYTDGVPDARPPGLRLDWFGLERLKMLLAQMAALPPHRLVSGIVRRILSFAQGRLDDDVLLMAVRRRRSSSHRRRRKR